MSAFTPAVAKAIEEIRLTFEECGVEADADGSGGAFVLVTGVRLGQPYAQKEVWIGFQITFQYPYADVYPHFTNAELARSDGNGLGAGFGSGAFPRTAGNADIASIESTESPDGHGGIEIVEGIAMDEEPLMKSWRLTLPSGLYEELQGHLFPGDGDEHGAVILAGTCESDRGLRLVARELHLAQDGVDYVPGKRGYRMLKAEFIQSRILRARDRRLAYLAIHNHAGTDSVAFSGPDMASHERGYPALLDIARGMPVGALVFARRAVAGDLWLPGCKRTALAHAAIIGNRRQLLFPMPERRAAAVGMYDRQSRLFGDAGQEVLKRTRVGIVGLGGAGSVLAELLGRLGVGEFVLADPDRAEEIESPTADWGASARRGVARVVASRCQGPAAHPESTDGGA